MPATEVARVTGLAERQLRQTSISAEENGRITEEILVIMKNEDEKYQKILEILRKSRPRLSDESEMADEVIRRIREVK